MQHRSFAIFVLIVLAATGLATAQTSAPRPNVPETRAFSLFFQGEGSYLGVQTADVNKENFAKYGLREVRGVAVEKVIEGSPAQTAGLQDGDVILKFNGEEVTSVRKLTRLIGEVAPDHQARITVLRGGSEREITATLAKRPAPKFEEGAFDLRMPEGRFEIPAPPSGVMPQVPGVPDVDGDVFVWRSGGSRQIGISATPLTKQLGDHFGVADGKGLLINNVRENSPAAKAGLKAGDVIVEVDGKAIAGDLELIRAINEKAEGSITITFVRDRNRQTVTVTPEAAPSRDIRPVLERYERLAPEAMRFRMTRPDGPMAPAVISLHGAGRVL